MPVGLLLLLCFTENTTACKSLTENAIKCQDEDVVENVLTRSVKALNKHLRSIEKHIDGAIVSVAFGDDIAAYRCSRTGSTGGKTYNCSDVALTTFSRIYYLFEVEHTLRRTLLLPFAYIKARISIRLEAAGVNSTCTIDAFSSTKIAEERIENTRLPMGYVSANKLKKEINAILDNLQKDMPIVC